MLPFVTSKPLLLKLKSTKQEVCFINVRSAQPIENQIWKEQRMLNNLMMSSLLPQRLI